MTLIRRREPFWRTHLFELLLVILLTLQVGLIPLPKGFWNYFGCFLNRFVPLAFECSAVRWEMEPYTHFLVTLTLLWIVSQFAFYDKAVAKWACASVAIFGGISAGVGMLYSAIYLLMGILYAWNPEQEYPFLLAHCWEPLACCLLAGGIAIGIHYVRFRFRRRNNQSKASSQPA